MEQLQGYEVLPLKIGQNIHSNMEGFHRDIYIWFIIKVFMKTLRQFYRLVGL